MIIDTHVHIVDQGFWPDRWFDWVAYRWGHSQQPQKDPSIVRPKIEAGLLDPDGSRMVADMDAAGIDTAVIVPLEWGPDFEDRVPLEDVHRHAAGVVDRYPGRFVAFAGVDPRRPNAQKLLEWALSDLGMQGLKLYPPAGFYPYERIVYPLYEVCEAMGVPVTFHTGEGLALTPARFANPLYLQDVQAAFPKLTVWIGHSGAKLWWDEAVSVASNGVETYLELSAWIWDDTSEEDAALFVKRLARARDRLGAHRLLFGSDHLSGSRVRGRDFQKKIAGWFRDLPHMAELVGAEFSPEEMDLILGGNAARCLGIDGGKDWV